MKIHPVGTELYHAGGRTDKQDEANSRSSQFVGSCQKTISQLAITKDFVYYMYTRMQIYFT